MRRNIRDEEFREFYERSNDRAIGVARRMVGNSELAEDLAAESLARAYARWGKLRSHPNPDAWLFKVLGNLCIDHVRKASPRPELLLDISETNTANQATLRVDLADALSRLSPRQQEVVMLRYVSDLSEQDVALTLGMSPGAVKTHLHRATTRLRSELGDSSAMPVGEPTGSTEAPGNIDLTSNTAEIDLTSNIDLTDNIDLTNSEESRDGAID